MHRPETPVPRLTGDLPDLLRTHLDALPQLCTYVHNIPQTSLVNLEGKALIQRRELSGIEVKFPKGLGNQRVGNLSFTADQIDRVRDLVPGTVPEDDEFFFLRRVGHRGRVQNSDPRLMATRVRAISRSWVSATTRDFILWA
jgi:hypothetical protein